MPIILAPPDFKGLDSSILNQHSKFDCKGSSNSILQSFVGVITVNVYTGKWNARWKGDDKWYLNVVCLA